jgi:hypothetical protein
MSHLHTTFFYKCTCHKKNISDVTPCDYFIQYSIDSFVDLLQVGFSPLHLPIHFVVNLNITFNAVLLHLLTTSSIFYLTIQAMTEHVTQPINNADWDSDVQQIDPPVMLRST